MKSSHTTLGLAFILALVITPVASAQTQNQPAVNNSGLPSSYTLLEPLPCIPGQGVTCTAGEQKKEVNFKEYVQYMFNLLIAVAAVAAVFMIVWGGFEYMTTDSWSGKEDGRKKATNAILGLILILCSYLILRTVDPRLVEIPETFVPQLTLNYNRNAIGNYFDSLDHQLDYFAEYDATHTQERTKRDQYRNEAAVLTDQAEDLDAQIAALEKSGDTEARTHLDELKAERDAIDSKIDNLQAQYVSSIAYDNISGRITQLETEKYSLKDLTNIENAVDTNQRKAIAELGRQNPINTTEATRVNDQYYFAKSLISASRILQTDYKPNSTQYQKDLTNAQSQANQIKDPELKAQALQKIDESSQRVESDSSNASNYEYY